MVKQGLFIPFRDDRPTIAHIYMNPPGLVQGLQKTSDGVKLVYNISLIY
jgi:hypothetical protein